MERKESKKSQSGKLLKIAIRENGKTLMELLPTKANEEKARRMSFMAGIEVARIYEK